MSKPIFNVGDVVILKEDYRILSKGTIGNIKECDVSTIDEKYLYCIAFDKGSYYAFERRLELASISAQILFKGSTNE